jgi:hypothetical protein
VNDPKREITAQNIVRGLSSSSEIREVGGKRHGKGMRKNPRSNGSKPRITREQVKAALAIDPSAMISADGRMLVYRREARK